jgi:hypothetical protein
MSHGKSTTGYERYHIEARPAPDIVPWPSRFKVKVGKAGLARLLVKELIQYRGNRDVALSRPCMYGVFAGPVGGFAPREEQCVGCLRCTTQHPEFVEIRPNPERQRLGDSYFTFRHVDALAYEAATGSIPVKGAGYRGEFGGQGWDGMWTDMSEIVRPTRDGIHGREFISTVVDIGRKPSFLTFGNGSGPRQPLGILPETFSLPVPFLFDAPPDGIQSATLHQIVAQAAAQIDSLFILPLSDILARRLAGPHIVPLVDPVHSDQLVDLPFQPRLIEMDSWDEGLFRRLAELFPQAMVAVRRPFGADSELLRLADQGVSVFHLTADYHGRSANGSFITELIRAAHKSFVEAGRRDEVTLLGSGGIIAAEHVPKAIILGLDAVVLDTPLLVALQGRFEGEFASSVSGHCLLPNNLPLEWGVQRLQNMAATWRDQLLEILGAMGLREVRRLRGEIGRAMFQTDLEREAFAGIEGYHG